MNNNPPTLLDRTSIHNAFKQLHFSTPYTLHLLQTIDSTNQYLKDLPSTDTLEICIAEQQTQGRGRFGRHWHSPFGENIYLSSRWNLQCEPAKLAGLSLVTSLAIVNALKELQITEQIKIKWPNDIMWKDEKLCGSLIEIVHMQHNITQVVIGIGMNVNSDTVNNPLADKVWCSLYKLNNQYFDRNQIVAYLISNLEKYVRTFLAEDLNVFTQEWEELDYLHGKKITVSVNNQVISGIARGVTDKGLLILEDVDGSIRFLSSGDTTLTL